MVHGIPSGRLLKEGDIVSVDTGCKLDGWCADSALTYAVGRVHPDVQRLLDVTSGVLKLAIELMGRKNYWSQVAIEMATFVRDHGFSVVENFVGHGIGRDMHEEPQVPNFFSPQLRRNNDFRLEPGLVIAVEPMVNMGTKKVKGLTDHWTQVTADGRPSAHFEHTVAITEQDPGFLPRRRPRRNCPCGIAESSPRFPLLLHCLVACHQARMVISKKLANKKPKNAPRRAEEHVPTSQPASPAVVQVARIEPPIKAPTAAAPPLVMKIIRPSGER